MWKSAASWILACGLAACGGGDYADPPVAPAVTPPSAVTATIGALGGTVTGPDGVQVIVPPGALSQATTIGIARSAAGAPALSAENTPSGSIFEFTPHGLVFNAPVTIRMPMPADATGTEVFMASPSEDWQSTSATAVNGMAEWERNSFSWGLIAVCALPIGSTDPYPCAWPHGGASASAVPASAIARRTSGYPNGDAGSWVVKQAGAVTLTLRYTAAPDCGNSRVKLLRWNPAASPRVVQILLDTAVALTPTAVTVPLGIGMSNNIGPTLRGKGSTTFDVSAYLGDATNAFGFSFSCARPGRSASGGGDLITILGPMPAPVGPYSIGGTVSGLSGAGLVLQNNGGDNLNVAANANAFSFATLLANGTAYSVSVLTQPSGQSCTLQNASGTASANVANVAVTCVNVSAGPGPLVATAMATGYASSLVVASDGTVWAWGYKIDPATGGYKDSSPWATRPVQVQGLAGVKAVSLSADAAAFYALHTDGTVSAWGLNADGKLGDRTVTTRLLPVKVMQDATTPMDQVCAITASAHILVMLRQPSCSGSAAVAWIVGWFSGSGLGGDTSSSSPTNGAIARAVPGMPAGVGVKSITAPHSANAPGGVLFLLEDGRWLAWGNNANNKLGAGASTPFAGGVGGPADVSGFWAGICCAELGRTFGLALKTATASLVSVGGDLNGELGNGSGGSNALLPVSLLSNVTAFSAGQVSAAAITAGQLWAWGWNGNAAVQFPTRVGTGSGFTQVSVGDIHSLAIGPGGEVYSWGDSTFGGLGRSGSTSLPAVVMRP